MLAIPGYENLTAIGRGGFAVVYRARATAFNRDVAVKVLSRQELDDRAVRLFERERAAMGTLSAHPNIVTIYDAGLADGIPYLVMEYLPGGSLGDRVDRDGPLPWEEALSIGIKLAGALEAAHRAGLLHRDVKPENVFVSAYGEPELGDFGIVRTVDLTDTSSNDRSLSVPYAAPEVISGEDPSVSSDIYSLAATIYALVAGTPPFHRDGDASIVPHLARIATEPPPDLRAFGAPGLLSRVLQQAMAKSPLDRPPSALVLGEDLQNVQRRLGKTATPIPVRVVGDAPTAPRPSPAVPTAAPPPPSPRRRRRVPVGAAAAVLAVLAMVATGIAVQGGGDDAPEVAGPVVTTPTSAAQVAGVTATRPPAAFEPLPAKAGALPSGLYRTNTFTPALRFALPEGWRLNSPESKSVLDLTRTGALPTDRFSFVTVTRVLDASRAYTAPDDVEAPGARQPAPPLVEWLRAHPRLSTSEPQRRTLGDLTLTEIDVSVSDGYDWDRRPECEGSCVLLFAVSDNSSFYLTAANTNRLYVFDVAGTSVVGVVEARRAGFVDLATEAEKVLASVVSG